MFDALDLFVFAGSLLVLASASRTTISSSIDIARILRISEFAVGFVLIAVATSLPEFFVSVLSSIYGRGGIAMGNVIGANIADIALVLALTALIGTVTFKRRQAIANAEILLLMSFIPLVLMGRGSIGLISGLVLLLIFILYAYITLKRGNSSAQRQAKKTEPTVLRLLTIYSKFFGSILAVIVAANFVVTYGAAMARSLGMSDAFVGLTLISLGTTLPELAVNLTAVGRKRFGLAIGNILGSCVTNLTLVLGTAAIINPITVNAAVFGSAMIFLIGLNTFLWYQLQKGGITKTGAVAMVLAYIVFILVQAGLVSLP